MQDLIGIYSEWLLAYELAHPQDLNWMGPGGQWQRDLSTFVSTVAPCEPASSGSAHGGSGDIMLEWHLPAAACKTCQS